MKDIKKFIQQFTEKDISGIEKIGREYYLADDEVRNASGRISREPFSTGIFLGEKKKEFRPSPALIDMIARMSDRKAFINKDASWLFLCGRDVFETSIIKQNVDSGLVLVQNERDENLGYGEFRTKGKNKSIKNFLDKGYYLRREKH